MADKVQTLISFYLLNKMLRYVGIILLVEFSKYLERFSMIWSGIRYIWHKQFDLLFIEPPCIHIIHTLCNMCQTNVANTSNNRTMSNRSSAFMQKCHRVTWISTNEASSSSSDVSSSQLYSCINFKPLLSIKLRNVWH